MHEKLHWLRITDSAYYTLTPENCTLCGIKRRELNAFEISSSWRPRCVVPCVNITSYSKRSLLKLLLVRGSHCQLIDKITVIDLADRVYQLKCWCHCWQWCSQLKFAIKPLTGYLQCCCRCYFGFSIAQILIKITSVKFISYDNPSQKSVASLIIKFHKVV